MKTLAYSAFVLCALAAGCGAPDDFGADQAADEIQSEALAASVPALHGLNWSRYRRRLQSDHLYNGTLFGIQPDVWILGAYRSDSCDVRERVRRGCVYDYVMVEVGPLGRAAGHRPGQSAGEIVYDETPALVPGFSPEQRVTFTISVTADSSGSYAVGDVQTFIQARVLDRTTGRVAVAEWQADDPAGPVPGFKWETPGGTAYRERFCRRGDEIYPGNRCAAYCTEGAPSHPTVPRCPLFPRE